MQAVIDTIGGRICKHFRFISNLIYFILGIFLI